MCGIVGVIGNKNANEIVLRGLEKLEYRGYDSCGITYLNNKEMKLVKSVDRIKELKENVSEESSLSFGHTRWATHGKVNLENAHPHFSSTKKMYMVHNGVIENFRELKEELNVQLVSETDTEIICNLLEKLYVETKDMKKAISKFMEKVEGSYACIVYNDDFKDELFVMRNKSPMVIGKKDDFFTISSDPIAVIEYVSDFTQLDNKEYAIINKTNKSIEKFDMNSKAKDVVFETIEMKDFDLSPSKEYEHYMLKEIEEQPLVIENIVNNYKNITIDKNLIKALKKSSKVYIVASGTSYYAACASKKVIQNALNVPVECVIGSEYGYEDNIIEKKAMFIFLSQSGETADSMVVFNKVVEKYPTLAITNVLGSQMDRNADFSLNLYAGVEVAVASTKAYIAQITVLNILMSKINGDDTIYKELLIAAQDQRKVIEKADEIKEIAKDVAKYKEAFYLGRLRDYEICLEASLKVKEVTYINVNAYPAGELKHGPISLIDNEKITMTIITDEKISPNTRSNVEEVRARDGKVLIFSTTQTKQDGDDFVVDINFNNMYLRPLVAIMPHQYISYFVALELGLDVDKPRNLAKSVTVE